MLAPLDAILYIGHESPTVLLFQSARLDQGIPQSDAQAFFDAASEPKELPLKAERPGEGQKVAGI